MDGHIEGRWGKGGPGGGEGGGGRRQFIDCSLMMGSPSCENEKR